MRRLLLALPLIAAACGPKTAEAPAAAPEAPAAAPAPAPAPPVEPPAAAPAPAPAPEAAPAKATPAPAPAIVLKAAPAATPVADAANGQKIFIRCRACHTLVAGGVDGIGPNLHGLFGRKAGSKAGYNYSPALAAAGFTWSTARVDAWVTDPKAVMPGNKMVFPGLKDAKDRADLIAYLQAETR